MAIMTNLSLLFLFTEYIAAAIIVSVPHERYVLEGNWGTVRCQNKSDNEQIFYSYVTNAIWYRDYENGTASRIGSSGPVYSSGHVLNFVPTLRKVDEGVYYCCVPNGPCSNSSRRNTVLKISTPPMISAANSTHTSTIGSNITLICNIIDQGVPQAAFSWSRTGYELNGKYAITINSSVMAITLTALTFNDSGVYTCTATGLLSYRSANIELVVMESVSNMTTEVRSQLQWQAVQVLAEHLGSLCNNTEPVYLDTALQSYFQRSCNCTNFTINAILLNCIDNSRALYTVQITGLMADNILQLWSNFDEQSPQGIDVGVAILSLCNTSCLTMASDDGMPKSSNETSINNDPTTPLYLIVITILLLITMITLITLLGFLCLIKSVCKWKMKLNIQSHDQLQSIANTTVIASSQTGDYDKLQYDYGK